MSLVANAIDALFNGVSQQPANMRLPSQCEDQVNGYATVADGLRKRPCSQLVAKLTGTVFSDPHIHMIDRDADNRYALILTDGDLSVYDLSTGASYTVTRPNIETWAASTSYGYNDGTFVQPTTPNGYIYRQTDASPGTSGGTEPTWPTTQGSTVVDNGVTWEAIRDYLDVPAGMTPEDVFTVVTVADYSFIVNKTITVKTTPTGGSTPGAKTSWYFPDNWTGTSDDRYYVPTIGVDNGKVNTMQDLPTAGGASPPSEGDFYTIEGDSSTGFSKHYVIYRSGAWQETHYSAGSFMLDEATMPHALVKEGSNFVLRHFGWIPRLYGDDDSNPAPSFVGQEIQSIIYYKNRLAFAAGENIIFSCAGDYGNFFRNTVTQLLDSDVVDVAVSTSKIAEIKHLVSAENGLMFFSESAQFALNVDQILTPSTVSVDAVTSYDMNVDVEPVPVGQDVYFVTETGNYSRVREYTLRNSDEVETDATDITAHVSRYLPKNITQLAGSPNEDVLFLLSNETGYENRVYVYKFFYSAGEKVQSAWSYWEMGDGDTIRAIAVLNSKLYMVIERSDGTYLEYIDVQQTVYPLALDFDVYLDHRYNFAGGDKSYDSVAYTTFTFPYALSAGEQAVARLVQADGATPGRVLTIYDWPSSTTCRVAGDWTTTEVLGGLNYTMTYQFSEQFHRRPDGRAITVGKYQLRTFSVVFEDYATFNTHVDPYGNGDGLTEDIVTAGLSDFTAKTIGADTAVLGEPTFEDGVYSFQIYGNSKDAIVKLTNDQPFGGSFVSATVEGFFTNRGR